MNRQIQSSQAKPKANPAPHPLHLAFAIAIIKSKPDELSVKDYILRLRESFTPRTDPRDQRASQQRFDAAAFWQKRCERAETTQAALQAQIMDLERALDKMKVAAERGEEGSHAGPSRKKTAKGAADSASSRSKRKRGPGEIDDDAVADIHALEDSGKEGLALARHLYKAHKLCPEADVKHRDLSYHLVQASKSLTTVVVGARQRYEQRIASKGFLAAAEQNAVIPEPVMSAYQTELKTAFDVATRSFTGILRLLNKLAGDDPSAKEATSGVIFGLVTGFSGILDEMRETARSQAGSGLSDAGNGRARRGQKTKKPQDGLDVAHELFKFLFSCLTAPSPNDLLHRQVFEGFLFVILQRCGKRVFQCSFGHVSTGTVEGDIHAWNHPESNEPTAGSIDDRVLSLELQYLILLFRRAVAVAPKYLVQEESASTLAKPKRQRTATGATRKIPLKASTSTLRAGLGLVARKRLQQTLFNAVFEEGSENDEFMDCLRMPTQPVSAPQIPKVEPKDIKSWFEEELWNVLGWDVLQQAVEGS
ncbi:hypothetical protein IWX90DRAFT_245654 [Phyllosticta citrichinensis]|uniref:Uncharacterized protein n=1 Tax=Phyllosticta citrichinensis TaxID=1130410 RepID=A0ABR1XQS8_9PEZI